MRRLTNPIAHRTGSVVIGFAKNVKNITLLVDSLVENAINSEKGRILFQEKMDCQVIGNQVIGGAKIVVTTNLPVESIVVNAVHCDQMGAIGIIIITQIVFLITGILMIIIMVWNLTHIVMIWVLVCIGEVVM